ncbi:hypothetical protein L7F22_063912 [Adiantum nelumboides]|nr:hypothetical protein [Adiantum nelumboides]
MEAQENAVASLFNLSLMNENKFTSGALREISPLMDLLDNGSPQGKKDVACALFNLLICQGKKPRVFRVDMVIPILIFLMDSSKVPSNIVDELHFVDVLQVLHTEDEKFLGLKLRFDPEAWGLKIGSIERRLGKLLGAILAFSSWLPLWPPPDPGQHAAPMLAVSSSPTGRRRQAVLVDLHKRNRRAFHLLNS